MSKNCEFDIGLTKEEIASWDWMRHVLRCIRESGPEHQDFRNAAIFSATLNKVQDYCHAMHSIAHALEVENVKFEIAKTQMVVQPWGES